MSETAYVEFTVASQDISGDESWSNVNNALTNTGTSANCDVADKDGTSNILKLTDVDGALSEITGATIDGVEIEVYGSSESSANQDLLVKLIVGGVVSGTNKAFKWWSSTPSTEIYGGPVDTWGLSLSDTDLTATDFGIAFQVENPDTSFRNMYVYRIRVKVYYTGGGGESDTTKAMFALAAA